MKNTKILILEDEKPNAERLERLLLELRPNAQILAVLESVKQAIAWLKENEAPDLIMMDVRLSDGLSFEVFNHIEIITPIIFTTAYDEYAVKAFKYNSVDYLLKPIESDELEAALKDFDEMSKPKGKLDPAIENLLSYLQPKQYRTRFLLPFRDSYKSVLVSNIAYFYTELNVTCAKLLTGEIEVIPHSLEQLEQELDTKSFFRVSRQFILQIDSIKQVHNYFNGKLKVELKNSPEVEVIISRKKAVLLKSWLGY
ncbi:MAG: LytTR family DNA-binding domain-containing protein [Sphingobacterium sp.]|jgi:DNA-binding LytR/AlgR family response regulator|nr:LytTR family DNA-binding domain-containing protein [Sphingobacterium sp.]